MSNRETVLSEVKQAIKELREEELSNFDRMNKRQLEQSHRASMLALESDMRESLGDIVDPSDYYTDENGGTWQDIGSEQYPDSIGITNRIKLSDIRRCGRMLAATNEFAINALENRVSFIVGTGIQYTLNFEEGTDESSQEDIEELVKNFLKENEWTELEQELVLRGDRDGEWLLRFFLQEDETVMVRVIEPEQVYTPDYLKGRKDIKEGILVDMQDQQKVLGYYVDEELVDAEEIIHRKFNVDRNVTRGVSTLWAVKDNFKRAERLQRNMSTVAAIQAALVGTRSFESATKRQVEDFLDSKSTLKIMPTQSASGSGTVQTRLKTRRIDRWTPGTILNVARGQKIDFYTGAIDATKFIAIQQSELRAIAARFVMPEYMLTSDASNANYSSTLEAGTPAYRMFDRKQANQIKAGVASIWKFLKMLVAIGRVSEESLLKTSVSGNGPTLQVRDPFKETQANKIKHENGVMSARTWASKEGLDYEHEQANIAAELAEAGGYKDNPLIDPPDENAK